jgi:hypothetical protein
MNRKERSVCIPLLVVALGISGCDRNPIAPVIPVPPDVLAAPSQIAVGNTTLRLETYLWRNFQPGPSTETPLLAQLRIQADGGSAIPSGLHVEKAWLVLDNQAWLSTPQQEGPPPNASTLEVMSRGGPAWPVGALVTVVAQVRDGGNLSYLLRAAPQLIARVE